MTADTKNERQETALDRVDPFIGSVLARIGRADGVGDLLATTREFVANEIKPGVAELIEPDTGIRLLSIFTKDGVNPIPSTYFDTYRDGPRRRQGTASLTRLESFIDHVKRFGDEDSAVFADDNRSAPSLTAVLDYHRADYDGGAPEDVVRLHGEYRHGKHRASFLFPLSDEWKAWTARDGKAFSMAEFAVFLEDRIGDIALMEDDVPELFERFVNVNGGGSMIADHARLVELSRGLKIYEDAVIEEAQVLSSGEGHLRFSVEHRVGGANGGTVKVPTMFFIAIPIFRKGEFYRIAARLRYRKGGDGVKFWYDLWRPDLSFDDAFGRAVEKVDASVPAQLFYGAPEY